jgi:protein-tyrosine-phosphatase
MNISSPILVCILIAAAPSAVFAQAPAAPVASPNVVFVCEHGAARSVIAATYFNQFARERGLPERAVARGTNIDAAFSPAVISGLRKEGMPLPPGKPVAVTAAEVAQSNRLVTLGCRLPDHVKTPANSAAWDDVPSPGADFDAAKDVIVRHVQELVDEISRAQQHPGR